MRSKSSGAFVLVATTVVSAILAAGPASAESLQVFSGPGTAGATSEEGTGRMTSEASSASAGGGDSSHPGQIVTDSFGRVASETPVVRGAKYRVTVTFDDARTTESTTGAGATARGFGEVQLWNCCFAGELTFIRSASTELASTTSDAQVVTELTPAQDMRLNIQVLLHSYAATSTAEVGRADVESTTERTTVDVTKIADAPTTPKPPKPKRCLLFLCI